MHKMTVSEADRIWIDELHRRKEAGESVVPWDMLMDLADRLPRDFKIESLDSTLTEDGALTLLGLYAVDPKSPLLEEVQQTIVGIRDYLRKERTAREVSASELADFAGLPAERMEELFFLVKTAGRFFSGNSGAGEQHFQRVKFDESCLRTYMAFTTIDDLLSDLVQERESARTRTAAAISTREFADQPGPRSIFVSWSGDLGRQVGRALRDLLPGILNNAQVWMSSADIKPGMRWGVELADCLDRMDTGIVVLTRGSLASEWLLYEAGALSKRVDWSRLIPYCVDVDFREIPAPLTQFQAVRASRSGTRDMVRALVSDPRQDPAHFDEAFELWWASLEQRMPEIAQEEGERADVPAEIARPTSEAMELLHAAVQDSAGSIRTRSFIGGYQIHANGRRFVEKGDARSRAIWDGALAELQDQGLVIDRSGQGSTFAVTERGYRAADS